MSLLIAVAIFFFFFWFIPGIVASSRHHRQRVAIWVLTILLGWTVVAWVAALVWACTSDVDNSWHYKVKPMDMSKLKA